MSCVHNFVQNQDFSFIYPISQRMIQFCLCRLHAIYPYILAPDCIATLLEFSSSGMPVSVLSRDHEYTATYSIQVLSTCKCQEGKKGMQKKPLLKKKKKKKIKAGLQMCMTFKSSMKSHSSPACDNLYLYAKKKILLHLGIC